VFRIELHALKPEHLALIASETHGVLFAWRSPWSFSKPVSRHNRRPVAAER